MNRLLLPIHRLESPILAEKLATIRYKTPPVWAVQMWHTGDTNDVRDFKYFNGNGHISGVLKVNGQVAQRRILVIDAATNRVIRQTWSNKDGTYRIERLDHRREYHVIAIDHKREYEPWAVNFIKPCTT